MEKKKSGNYKKYIIMVIVMILILLAYFITSGFFGVSSTLSDVFSTSKSEVVAEGTDWQLCVPEKKGLSKYWLYRGDKHPSQMIHVTGEIYYKNNNNTESKNVIDQYWGQDKHFFVGEKRWYMTKEYTDVTIEKVDLQVTFQEYKQGEMFSEKIASKI